MKKIDDIDIYKFTDSKNSVMYDQYWDSNIGELIHGINKIKDKYVGTLLKSVLNDVISLKTAKGRALDMWGLLLNFNRSIEFDDKDLLIDLNDENFDNLEIINNDPTKKRGSLKDDPYRTVLQLRLHAQNTLADIVFMSPLLSDVIGSRISINDELDMKYVTYYVRDELPAWLDMSLSELDILPRPAGCGSKIESSLYRYVYFYPGANIQELGTFYFSIFFGEEENPYYKSIKKYINPVELYKPFLTWYNPNLYKEHIKKDEDSIKAKCQERIKEYEKLEYLQELIEGYEEEIGYSLKPGLWSEKRKEVFDEYYNKPKNERNDMPESWHIKEAELYLINARRYYSNNMDNSYHLDELDDDYNLQHKFFYEDEVPKYLFYNENDGYYYTTSNFNINSITSWCMHNNYLWQHVGLSDFYTTKYSILFKEDDRGDNPWEYWKNGNIDRLNQYLEVDNLMMLGVRRIKGDIVYGEMPRNPFYEYWEPKLNNIIDRNDKIHNFLGDDKDEKTIEINEFDSINRYSKKEVIFMNLYKLLLIFRNTNQKLIQHLWDLKQCHLDVAAVRACADIYRKITNAPVIQQVRLDENKNVINPEQAPSYYENKALVYKKTAENFGSRNHGTELAELYKIRADNLREEGHLFRRIQKLHFKECQNIIKDTFTHILNDSIPLMQDIKEKVKKLVSDDSNKNHWVGEFCDTFIQTIYGIHNECSDNLSDYKSKANNFLIEDRFKTWIHYGREGFKSGSDIDFLLKDQKAAKEAIEVAKGMWELGTFAYFNSLDLNGIKRKMHLISNDKIVKVGWDPNKGAWKRWQKDLVDNMSGDPRGFAGKELREYADKLETQFTNLLKLRTCELNNIGIRGRYLSSKRNQYVLCNSRILGDNDWYINQYPDACKQSIGAYRLPENKYSVDILKNERYN